MRALISFLIVFALNFSYIFSRVAYAQGQSDELVEFSEDETVKTADRDTSRKAALKDAVQRVTLKLSEEVMGKERADAARSSVLAKILPNYEKYIPLIRKTDGDVKGDVKSDVKSDVKNEETKVNFKLKVSVASFRTLLINEGILQVSDVPLAMLPVIHVQDGLGGTEFSWWTDGSASTAAKTANESAHSLSQRVQVRLQEGFVKSGLFVQTPTSGHFGTWVPEFLRRPNLEAEDLLLLARLFKSQVVLSGQLQVSRAGPEAPVHIVLRMSAIQVQQGRTVAEAGDAIDVPVATTEVTANSGPVADAIKKLSDQVISRLAGQLNEIWGRGGLSVQTLYLELTGELAPLEMDKLKGLLTKVSRSVRAVRDRRFASGAATLELDSASGIEDLVKELSHEKLFPGFDFRVTGSDGNTVKARIGLVR